jgi:hypothetical protein
MDRMPLYNAEMSLSWSNREYSTNSRDGKIFSVTGEVMPLQRINRSKCYRHCVETWGPVIRLVAGTTIHDFCSFRCALPSS